jgi:2-keto-4-pentenoate hydratase
MRWTDNMTSQTVSLSPITIETLAERQWCDYQARTPGTCFADPDLSLTRDEAYAVQIGLAALRCAAGDAVAGYKIGCIGPGIVEQFGMSGPIHGRLFRSEIGLSGDPVRYADYAHLAIEGEMALRIGKNGEIAGAFPVIELHHFVFRGARKTLPELIANNGINAGVIVSRSAESLTLDNWRSSRSLAVAINGSTVDDGNLWAMPGGAAEAIDWLRTDLSRFKTELKAGDIVLAGTPLGLFPVNPGDHVAVSVDGRTYVECHVL